jgi:DnaJ-class molecular chaperone
MARWIACDNCGGDAEVECDACIGTGFAMWDEDEILDGLDKSDVPCYTCLGEGTEPCIQCESTGGWFAE